jgi:hypothetical protein
MDVDMIAGFWQVIKMNNHSQGNYYKVIHTEKTWAQGLLCVSYDLVWKNEDSYILSHLVKSGWKKSVILYNPYTALLMQSQLSPIPSAKITSTWMPLQVSNICIY